jgi:5'-3' exonuclease
MVLAGFTVWPQVAHEADDALAAAAVMAAADDRVERVVICTPDKDLGQCVGGKVVQWDRRQDKWFDAEGVHARLGVRPESIPDLLALVGDTADGFPGLPGWGAKSAAAVLDRWGHLEDIPADPVTWDAGVRSAGKLNAVLRDQWERALLFRRIATVELDAPVSASVDELRWTGPSNPDAFAQRMSDLGAPELAVRASRLAVSRA